jgi:protein TonB
MKVALAIMLGVTVIFCAYALLVKNERSEIMVFNFLDPEMRRVNQEKKIEQPKPKIPSQKPVFNSQKFVSIIKMEKDSVDKLPDNLDDVSIGSVTITDGLEGTNLAGENNDGKGNVGYVDVPQPPAPDPATPIENPEIEPSFPGGINALRTFLQRNLINPRDLEEGEQVSVQVRFVVGYDGKLQRFETVKDGGGEFNNEVIRVLKKMPQWIAGKSNGKNVSVYYTIPVKFVPND